MTTRALSSEEYDAFEISVPIKDQNAAAYDLMVRELAGLIAGYAPTTLRLSGPHWDELEDAFVLSVFMAKPTPS